MLSHIHCDARPPDGGLRARTLEGDTLPLPWFRRKKKAEQAPTAAAAPHCRHLNRPAVSAAG